MPQWYVLRSKPHKEAAAASLLARAGIEVYLPQVMVQPLHGQPPRREPFFPGYFFGRLDAGQGQLRLARYTAGVLYVVGSGEEPWPVPDEVIASIQQRLAHSQHAPAPLRAGERVVITGGPLKDLEAIFDSHVSASGRVRVLLQLLQRVCRAEVHVGQLRRASQAAGAA